ncbi:properdin-like [Polymixia lowei]
MRRCVWTLLLLVFSCMESECVRCFGRFEVVSGQCEEDLGELEDEDDCCQNPHYGYVGDDGVCRSCGPPVWSPWSSWSRCSVLCGEGVRQRTRKCYGVGQSGCPDAKNTMQTEPCSIDHCCTEARWQAWGPWGPCSVSCGGGGGGVRRRERVCPAPEPGCDGTCDGTKEQTEPCSIDTPCPVHGHWSSWSQWGACSSACIQEQLADDVLGGVVYPTKSRHRSCSNPAPSSDTVPPGSGCQGDSYEIQSCSELPNCPVDGGWGAWLPPGLCSTSCGEGLQLSVRRCDSPTPKYGGRFCVGPSANTTVCIHTCPVHGFWSGWSSWGECSTSCFPEGRSSVRTRHRSCSNPAPSTRPPGNRCPGEARDTESCDHLPRCPVDGGWGSWGPFTSCSVSCGVGLQLSVRTCDSPTPKHGGRPCPGARSQTTTCKTNVHCPVNGAWSDWSSWGKCRDPFGRRDIRCRINGGVQTRDRRCLYRAHNGTFCSGDGLTERQVCFDISSCNMKGVWAGWSDWSLCVPPCGGNPRRFRKRICQPDISEYPRTIGRQKEEAVFHGSPVADCGFLPEGQEKIEIQPCLNVPPCP